MAPPKTPEGVRDGAVLHLAFIQLVVLKNHQIAPAMNRVGPLRLADLPILLRIVRELVRYVTLHRGRSYIELVRMFDAAPGNRIVPMAEVNRLMALTTSAVDLVFGGKSYLPRSFVLFRLLREAGIPVSICLGYDRTGVPTPAHAWLMLRNRPFRERRELISRYRFQYSYPVSAGF